MEKHPLLSKNNLAPVVALCLLTHIAHAITVKTSYQLYKNQRGSVLELVYKPQADNSGLVSGQFITAVANERCKDVIGRPTPVTGFYNGNAVSLSFSYPSCDSVVSLIGNIDKKRQLHALWIVKQPVEAADKAQPRQWNRNIIGHDDFMPIDNQLFDKATILRSDNCDHRIKMNVDTR